MVEGTIRRSLKERQRLEREELIFNTTYETFLEKGYHAMTMDDIAERVGIAKATIYSHFAKKEDLVIALFEREFARLLPALEQIRSLKATAQARLRLLFEFLYQTFYIDQLPFYTHVLESIDIQRLLKEQSLSPRSPFGHIAVIITQFLDEGKADGEFTTDIPTIVMYNILFDHLSLRTYESLANHSRLSPAQILYYIEAMYFRSISYHPHAGKP